MNDIDPVLTDLRKAGAMVGMSNQQWWLDLVERHGQDLVMAMVVKVYAATRQPVNAAVAGKACAEEAQRQQEERDDAAEDAAMDRQSVRTKPIPIPKPIIAAPAVVPPCIATPVDDSSGAVSTAGEATVQPATDAKAAAIAAPWGLQKTNQENDMTKSEIKQLLKDVEAEISRRGLSLKDAMAEIGVAPTAIYGWRSGQCGDSAQEKIRTWLPVSAATVPKTAASADDAEAPTPSRKAKREAAPAATVESEPGTESKASDLASLLTQGANLRDALNNLGSTGYADVVDQLTNRLRTMRAALSA